APTTTAAHATGSTPAGCSRKDPPSASVVAFALAQRLIQRSLVLHGHVLHFLRIVHGPRHPADGLLYRRRALRLARTLSAPGEQRRTDGAQAHSLKHLHEGVPLLSSTAASARDGRTAAHGSASPHGATLIESTQAARARTGSIR